MSLDQDIELLGKVPLFSGLSPDSLRLIAFGADHRDVPAGGRLFRRGDAGQSGYLIVTGAIELTTGSGRDRRVVETGKPGTLIGEVALFSETNRPYDATATEASELLEISRQVVQRLLSEYPAVAEQLQHRMAARLTRTLNALQQIRQRLLSLS